MATDGIDLPSAVHKCSLIHDELVRSFLETRDDVLQHMNGVPSWGEGIDTQVAAYVDGLGACCLDSGDEALTSRHSGIWVRGNYEWHFECQRYGLVP